MHRPAIRLAPVLALAWACGGGGSGADAGPPEVTIPDYGAPDPAGDPGRDGGPDAPADPGPGATAHPFWAGADWDRFWPGTAARATYDGRTPDGRDVDLATRLQDGMPLEGRSWTRVAFGTPSGDVGTFDALLAWVDPSVPWRLRVKQVEYYELGFVDGPREVLFFPVPLEVPLDTERDRITRWTGKVRPDPGDPATERDAIIDTWIETYDGAPGADDAFPDLSGRALLKARVWWGTSDAGEPDAQPDVVAHPLQRILLWTSPPGFVNLELKGRWQD